MAVWGRARYLSVTEAPHNNDFHTWMGKKHFYSFETAETGNWTTNSGVKGSGANHYPGAPALHLYNSRVVAKGLKASLHQKDVTKIDHRGGGVVDKYTKAVLPAIA